MKEKSTIQRLQIVTIMGFLFPTGMLALFLYVLSVSNWVIFSSIAFLNLCCFGSSLFLLRKLRKLLPEDSKNSEQHP